MPLGFRLRPEAGHALEEGRTAMRNTALALLAAGALGAGGCGGDGDEATTAAASAGRVTVTTRDTAGGRYTWEVSPTPPAETILVNFKNESQELHQLIFARLSEGYTVDEAYKLQGRKGSATQVMRTTAAPEAHHDAGPSGEIADVTKPLIPGDYVMLCPLAGKDGPHYKLGQVKEFAIEQGGSRLSE
jgi:hypothetical protein